MSRRREKRSKRASLPPREGGRAGAAPGSYETDLTAPAPVIRITAYDGEDLVDRIVEGPEAIVEYLERWPVTWVDVVGLGDTEVIDALGELFGLHPLALEDVVHVHQRAKAEDYGDYEFVVARAPRLDEGLDIEQVSLFLGPHYVLTFQEQSEQSLASVRERLITGRGRARRMGSDYLAYAVLDAVLDSYFPILERYSERLEELEDQVVEEPSNEIIEHIRDIRHDMVALRRAVWPHRDALDVLSREDNDLITGDTRVYLRDCRDHAMQILDLLESYRELSGNLMDFYLSTASFRMNEVMKVLTVIGAIFIPLTFITSLYGMNFDRQASPWNMPELGYSYGYPAVILVMALLTAGLLVYFYRKGWLDR